MKTKLIISAIALTIAGWCSATNYVSLTLYSDDCEKSNWIAVDEGQQVNVTAVPNEHRHFVKWSDGNTDNPRLVMITKDTTFTAEFAYDPYLTLIADEKGSVSGAGYYKSNTSCEISATADEHYHFLKWSDGNTDNPRIVTIESDTTFTAEFVIDQHTITVSAAEGGRAEGAGVYDYGTSVTLTAIPNEHYHFVKWNDGDCGWLKCDGSEWSTTDPDKSRRRVIKGENCWQYICRATDEQYTITVDSNATYVAYFALDQYTIYSSIWIEHGRVDGTGTYDYGSTATLTAIPNEDYHFIQWSDGNTDNPREVKVEVDAEYLAEFAPNYGNITAWGLNGNIEGQGKYTIGATVTLTAVANEHYHFSQWSDGNTDNPREVLVTSDATYTAEFAPNPYTISVTTVNGSVAGAGTYDYGTLATLTPVPNNHYMFSKWSDGNTDNPRTVLVKGDTTYTALFTRDPNSLYTVTTTCEISRGTVVGGGDYSYGTQITLTAYPNSGYEFKQWSNGLTYNPYRFTVLDDLTIKAVFVSDSPTALDELTDEEKTVQKVLIDGQVYIRRNGKTYTVTGVEVK